MIPKGNIVGERDDAPANDVENKGVGAVRITPKRALHVNLRDQSGAEISGSNPLPVSGSLSGTVDTELPAAAPLADNTANPTVPGVAAYQMGMDEAGGWDRARLSKVFNMDTGSGTENVVGVTLRKSASGGSVEYGTSTNPLYTAQTSLPLPTGAATASNQSTEIGHLASIAAKDFATSAKQDTGNASLSSIDSKLTTQTNEVIALQDIANLIASAVRSIAEAKGISADLRMTLLSGVLTSCGTVSTVTSLTQFAGYSAVPHIWSQMNQAAIQSNINNVVIS